MHSKYDSIIFIDCFDNNDEKKKMRDNKMQNCEYIQFPKSEQCLLTSPL